MPKLLGYKIQLSTILRLVYPIAGNGCNTGPGGGYVPTTVFRPPRLSRGTRHSCRRPGSTSPRGTGLFPPPPWCLAGESGTRPTPGDAREIRDSGRPGTSSTFDQSVPTVFGSLPPRPGGGRRPVGYFNVGLFINLLFFAILCPHPLNLAKYRKGKCKFLLKNYIKSV